VYRNIRLQVPVLVYNDTSIPHCYIPGNGCEFEDERMIRYQVAARRRISVLGSGVPVLVLTVGTTASTD
jgi:hypothetical protein